MKKLNTSVALAALAAIMATPAIAADVEAVPAAADWTAFHVGVGGGGTYGFADESVNAYRDDINNDTFLSGESFSDLGNAGGFGTVEAGYDYQMNSVVAGVLANYDFGKTKMKDESDATLTDNNNNVFDGDLKSSWEMGDSWAVGGRLGYLVTDSTLVYVLGGYTQAKIKGKVDLTGEDNNNNAFAFSHSDSAWEDGYFVGAGIEALLTESVSLKGEYRYADFGKVDRTSDGFGNHNSNFHEASEQKADITIHSIRAVLSYRF